MSPNLRYKESENLKNSSPDNKIIITDELKFSNYDSATEEKEDSQKEEFIQEGLQKEETPKESGTGSCK